jgi:uncharacterized protein with NAD-binding domain and iron-sulfur cluster
MADQPGAKKVAILGGGMGALTTAFELSEKGGYDITVYQMGWRLGGQGASGRNLNLADRIEEHGLHVWFGFYENAFQLMQKCYTELGRPPGAPLSSVEQAFRPVDSLTMIEEYGGERLPWLVEFPSDGEKPWDGSPIESLWSSVVIILKWMVEFAEKGQVESVEGSRPSPASSNPNILERFFLWLKTIFQRLFPPSAPARQTPGALPDSIISDAFHLYQIDLGMERSESSLLRKAKEKAETLPSDHTKHDPKDHDAISWLVRQFASLMWSRVKGSIQTDTNERRSWILLYLGATTIAGMLDDRVLMEENGFDRLDKYDMTDWFYAHKLIDDPLANDTAYRSAPTQTVYDLLFHYKDGDTNYPKLAAGVALRMLLLMLFQYKGSVLWFMQAAMGDTIFAPIYQVLRNRGVKFEFFNRVVNLGLSSDQKSLESVKISRQVNLKVGQYDPLVLIKDLPCWPSEPLYEQIMEGDQLRREQINLEHAWNNWQDTGGEITLQAGKDFDIVVLGIAIGALQPLTTELYRASEAWCRMIDTIETVQTQAIQLWMQPSAEQLGVDGPRPFDVDSPRPVVGGFAEPYSSWTDFSDLIGRENWPDSANLHSIAYSCGVLKHMDLDSPQHESQKDADERVYKIALDFMKTDSKPLWPKATRPFQPSELDWSKLVAPNDVEGEARFQAQYWRANIDPVERYVLSLPGTTLCRLKAGSSGFEHLVLAGNWIDTGFNIACIETAVMSGRQAAQAVIDSSMPDD